MSALGNTLGGYGDIFESRKSRIRIIPLKNFDFNGPAFTYYKTFVLEYGELDDFELLGTVYNFTSDDLKWNMRNSKFSRGTKYIASIIEWDPVLIFETVNNDQGYQSLCFFRRILVL